MESAGSSDVSAGTGARATDGEEAKREFRGTVVKIEPGNFFREMDVSHYSVHFECPGSSRPSSRILTLEPRQDFSAARTFMKPVPEANVLSDAQNEQRAATRA